MNEPSKPAPKSSPSRKRTLQTEVPDDDFQKGVPYAKADPYTGPVNATVRRSKIVTDNAGNRIGKITGGLQGESVEFVPIPKNQFKRGGAVQKSWHREMAKHQQRQSRPPAQNKPKGNW